MLYDLTTITLQPGSTAQALPKLQSGLNAAARNLKGELLACWLSEIGVLNRIMIVRSYLDMTHIEADRLAVTAEPDPLGIADLTIAANMETYAPFPFLQPMRPGQKRGLYEVRSYVLKPGGLGPTIEFLADSSAETH